MSKRRIAVTGANGLVGSRMFDLIKWDMELVPISHSDMDITNRDQTHAFLKDMQFDTLVHLAAYTNVDGAEKEFDTAISINETGTRNIFDAVLEKNKPFILLSTDFVFEGRNETYTEESPTHAISAYGQSKLNAEKVVGDKGMIVRIAYPYRAEYEKKKDFFRTLKSLMEQGRQLTMINDSLITPTFIDDIAFGLRNLIDEFTPQIFHLVGSDSLSPFDAGKLIAKTFNLDENLVQPTDYKTYFAGKAQRPQYSKIVSTKDFGYKTKTFEEGLQEIKRQLKV
jgi:dTDP-4-dehydrorhamnose reductase